MKSVLWFGGALVSLLGACGGINLTCQTQSCNTNASKSYQACVEATGKVDYKFGGTSCSCVSTNQSGCQACAANVATYCGDTVPMDSGTPTDAGSSCSIVGTFSHTSSSNVTTTFTALSTGTYTLVIITSTEAISIAGTYSVDANDVITVDNTSSPSDVNGCIGEPATYQLTFGSGCTTVLFTKISDQCTGRIVDANGSTLTRQ